MKDFSDFDLNSIKVLDLQRLTFKIGLIKCCSFSQLSESLQELNMVFETINDMDYSTFRNLTNLKKLSLKCRIKTRLVRIFFDDLVNLNDLILDGFLFSSSIKLVFKKRLLTSLYFYRLS